MTMELNLLREMVRNPVKPVYFWRVKCITHNPWKSRGQNFIFRHDCTRNRLRYSRLEASGQSRQCRQGKSAKKIRKFAIRIGSGEWGKGSGVYARGKTEEPRFAARRIVALCVEPGLLALECCCRILGQLRSLFQLFLCRRTLKPELLRTRGIRLFNQNKALRRF